MNTLIKTKNGYMYQLNSVPGYPRSTLEVDGNAMETSFLKDWMVSKVKPKRFKNTVPRTRHIGFTLLEEFKGKGMEEELPVDAFIEDENGYLPKTSHVYERKYETYNEVEEGVIVWDKELDESVGEPVSFKGIAKMGYSTEEVIVDPVVSMEHAAFFPEPVIPTKPAALTSPSVYKIVRAYIKDNINPLYAEITSDYDFCFTVKKRLAIPPEKRLRDANMFYPRRKPKMISYTVDNRQATVFQMTNTDDNYKGYTPIAGITADNHQELKKKMDTILENIISVINDPLVSCTTCEGAGVIPPKKIKTGELTDA